MDNRAERHRQLPLPISARAATPLASTLPLSKVNARAVAMVETWLTDLGEPSLVIAGPEGCGKTSLTHNVLKDEQVHWLTPGELAQADFSAVAADLPSEMIIVFDQDAELASPVEMMRFINICLEQQLRFVLIGRGDPSGWAMGAEGTLSDLETRLAAMPQARFARAEEEQLSAYFNARLAERQIRIPDETVTFAISRLQRSYKAVDVFVEQLDAEALHRQKSIDKAMIQDVIDLLPEYALM
jgi:chromosomal replication initiation ATPase DnaA